MSTATKTRHKSKTKWNCLDCGYNTKLEHFFVHTALWNSAGLQESGMVCVGCLEARIGRLLVPGDFTGAHINNPRRYAMTDRLRGRINGDS